MARQTLHKQPYDNCWVESPEGVLIFHTSYKRAGWYVEHGLAVKLCDDPLRIRLTFQPKGPGHACEGEFHLLIPRENHCVVCGAETDLTLHHVVPYQYRRYMPLYDTPP